MSPTDSGPKNAGLSAAQEKDAASKATSVAGGASSFFSPEYSLASSAASSGTGRSVRSSNERYFSIRFKDAVAARSCGMTVPGEYVSSAE
jgi:hypothetical protein